VVSGAIGEIVEVHYYNGNRGAHRGRSPAELRQLGATPAADRAWWFDAQRGGGALHDYLGYGATFGTWFRGGLEPTEVLAMQHTPDGYPVDLQVAVLARYTSGLSTLQARWGTFTDPWETQPQPGCGFVIVGDEGTIQSLDLQSTVRVQTAQDPKPRELAVDELRPEERGPLAAIASAVRGEAPIPRPLDVGTGLAGQRLVDAAVESIRTGTPVRPDTLGGARP
jgi:predicted dehydrogenase